MQAFAEIAGAEWTRAEENALVVAPANAEQLSAVLQHCTREKLNVTTTGGGTKSGWGNSVDAQVRIETSRMGGVLEHSWQDLTATAGAGTTWAALQRALAQHGQRVACDPLFAEKATVGGVLSTNDCGLLRMRYGALRDLVIGMTIVLADGTIARAGGKVVKNVAGYDLPKLLTGSFGTLGIITDATFRLHPIARDTASFTVRGPDIAALADLMHVIVTSGMSVEAMQLRNESEAFALDVQFAAVPEALREHEQRLRKLAGLLRIEASVEDFYAAREALFHIEGATVLKLTTLPTKLAALVAGFAQIAAYGATAQVVGDPAGVVTAAIVTPPEGAAAIVEDLRARLHDIGGTVTVLRRGVLPADVDPWNDAAHAPAALDVMRAIKHEFDPLRLLNPGRFIGGL
jgi:glycolate oxidase FAD binding subunit